MNFKSGKSKLNWILLVFILFSNCGIAQLPDSSRLVNWKIAGYKGKKPKSYQILNFKDLGGKGDGVTPNDSVFKVIYKSIAHDSAQIYFPPGTYFFVKSLVINRPLVLKGASSDSTILLFREDTARHLISVGGQVPSQSIQIIQNDMPKGSRKVVVANPAGYAKGMFIEISDNDSANVVSNWGIMRTGQIAQIDSISGNTFFLTQALRRNYNSTNILRVKRYKVVQNVGIENLKIKRLDSTTSQTANIQFQYTANCWVKCIESEDCNFAHISAFYNSNLEITGNYFHDAFSFGGGGKGYGVLIQSTTGESLIANNLFRKLRHSMILQSGANGNVFAYNYSIEPYWTEAFSPTDLAGDLVLHGNYPYANLFEGNTVANIVIDASHGINGPDNLFFRNRAYLYGLLMSPSIPSNNQIFIGNEITSSSPGKGSFLLAGTGHFVYGNNIKGTITPLGTDTLKMSSLYYDTIPSYYQSQAIWPPIGIPNSIGSNLNEVQNRFNYGAKTMCSPLSAVGVIAPQKPEVKVFPNPTSNIIHIQSELLKLEEEIEILDFMGRICKIENPKNSGEVSLKGLPNGIYLIKFKIDKYVLLFRIVKN